MRDQAHSVHAGRDGCDVRRADHRTAELHIAGALVVVGADDRAVGEVEAFELEVGVARVGALPEAHAPAGAGGLVDPAPVAREVGQVGGVDVAVVVRVSGRVGNVGGAPVRREHRQVAPVHVAVQVEVGVHRPVEVLDPVVGVVVVHIGVPVDVQVAVEGRDDRRPPVVLERLQVVVRERLVDVEVPIPAHVLGLSHRDECEEHL